MQFLCFHTPLKIESHETKSEERSEKYKDICTDFPEEVCELGFLNILLNILLSVQELGQ